MKGPSSRRLSLLRLRAAPELRQRPGRVCMAQKKPSGIPSLSGRTVDVSRDEGQAAAHQMRARATAVKSRSCADAKMRAAGRGGRDGSPASSKSFCPARSPGWRRSPSRAMPTTRCGDTPTSRCRPMLNSTRWRSFASKPELGTPVRLVQTSPHGSFSSHEGNKSSLTRCPVDFCGSVTGA
jgi:hypothetical protein